MNKYTHLKFMFLLSLILKVSLGDSQITITQANTPAIGNVFVIAQDTSPTVTPGSSGANILWNLKALKDDGRDSLRFIAPSGTPYFSYFPSSNITAIDTGFGRKSVQYNYYTSSSKGLFFNGYVIDTLKNSHTLRIQYNPSDEFLLLTATYDSIWGGTYRFIFTEAYHKLFIDSLRIIQNIRYADTIDGWGKAAIPKGVFSSIRDIHWEPTTVDSTLGYDTLSHSWIFIHDTTITDKYPVSYTWYTNEAGFNYPLVTMNINDTSGAVSKVSWLFDSTLILGINKQIATGRVAVYPVPADNFVTFTSFNKNKVILNVMDMEGRILFNREVPATNNITLNTSSYPCGLYFYLITDENGVLIGKGKFIISR